MILWLLACSGGPESAEPAPTTGTVRLDFSVSNGVRENTNLVDPLKGAIYASLFRAEEVTATGPIEGAESYGDVEVYGVDVTTDEVSAQTWASGEMEPATYRFLGFFDVDGNGDESRDPDGGDPVTLPSVNEFEVLVGEEIQSTIRFDLIFN